MYDSKGTLNKVVLIGRLGADPELRYTNSSSSIPVTNISVATNQSHKGENGEYVDSTEWHRVVLWRKTAEFAAEHAYKGAHVLVEGRIQTRSYDDKDGIKRYTTDIVATTFQILSKIGKKEKSETQKGSDAPPWEGAIPGESDDLPF